MPLNCNSDRPFSSLRADVTCVSDVFSDAGYDCAYFGKLHAESPTPNDPKHLGKYLEDRVPVWDAYTPKERRHGFNYWYSYGTFDDPKNSPYSEAMNIPFLVRFPDKVRPGVENLILSSPDIMPTLLGLAGLSGSIPTEVQGRNYAPLFFNEKADIARPAGALYIQNLDGKKDTDGKVRSYFPSSRGFKTAHYTLALYIDREKKKLVKSRLLFDDKKDPYQMNNLPLEENQAIVKELCTEMGKVLKEIDDPWYREGILKGIIPYSKA